MYSIVNLLFALALIFALVIAFDPRARQRATELVRSWEPTLQKWDETILINIPSIDVSSPSSPMPALTPVPTPVMMTRLF